MGVVVLSAALLNAEIAFREESPITSAAMSFGVSFAAFQLLAWSTFYAEIAWRAVDYVWVGAAAITIVMATAKIDSESQRRDLQNTGAIIADSIDLLRDICKKVEPVFKPSTESTTDVVIADAPVIRRLTHDITYDCGEVVTISRLVRNRISSPAWPEEVRSLDSDMFPLCDGKLVIHGATQTAESRPEDFQRITELRDQTCEAMKRVETNKGRRFRARKVGVAALFH